MLVTQAINPQRANWSDDPLEILRFAAGETRAQGASLATLIDIRGGGARALGSHVAIAADGRFCGYVSGGCVEAAVASEALNAMAEGCDRTIKYGEGSPFFDIALPCGGGITVAVHIIRDPSAIEEVVDRLGRRLTAGLTYSSEDQSITVAEPPYVRAVFRNGSMQTVYRPTTRIVISGQTGEARTLIRLAGAAGYEVCSVTPGATSSNIATMIDPYSAVVLLHHDLDAETKMLEAALQSQAFYIGALGSMRTHQKRLERLHSLGLPFEALDRIKAPIGLFGPTRDTTSLALSVLADVSAARLEVFT